MNEAEWNQVNYNNKSARVGKLICQLETVAKGRISARNIWTSCQPPSLTLAWMHAWKLSFLTTPLRDNCMHMWFAWLLHVYALFLNLQFTTEHANYTASSRSPAIPAAGCKTTVWSRGEMHIRDSSKLRRHYQDLQLSLVLPHQPYPIFSSFVHEHAGHAWLSPCPWGDLNIILIRNLFNTCMRVYYLPAIISTCF